MERLKIAVAGVGFIGTLHARAISEYPLAQLVAVADVDEERGKEAARVFSCKWHGDLGQLLEREEVDAVDICTPEEYHLDGVKIAAAHKKHILLEKPMAKTYEESLLIKKVAEENGVRLMVGHILHFDPRYAKLQEAVQAGQLGRVVSMFFRRANWKRTVRRLGGRVSFLYYMCIHDIEWMLCCNQATWPKTVYAQGTSWVNKEVGQQDTAFITVRFANGSLACLQVTWAMPENPGAVLQTGAEILGDKGIGWIDGRSHGVEIITEGEVIRPDLMHWPEYHGMLQGDLKEEIHHFVEATLGGQAYLVDTDTSILAVGIIEAALASMESGLPVQIMDGAACTGRHAL